MTTATEAWKVTRVANACVLIEINGVSVLTDPCFSSSPAFKESATIAVNDLPALTAIVGSHWAMDHWEIQQFAGYPHKSTTQVFVSDQSMAESARAVGFEHVEQLAWGERRALSPDVEIEVIEEHAAADGMLTNNYAFNTTDARVFYGGEVLDIEAVSRYASSAAPFDAVIGPVNGVTFKGRQLVATAAEMLDVTTMLQAPTLIPIHDAHIGFGDILEIKSSTADLFDLAPGDVEIVNLGTGEGRAFSPR